MPWSFFSFDDAALLVNELNPAAIAFLLRGSTLTLYGGSVLTRWIGTPAIDNNWLGKPEFLDRCCDRINRFVVVAWVVFIYGYPKKEGLAAMQRGIQYHAYGYQSLERILAHIGTPKPNWELLRSSENEAEGGTTG